jgi:hypothetical protein
MTIIKRIKLALAAGVPTAVLASQYDPKHVQAAEAEMANEKTSFADRIKDWPKSLNIQTPEPQKYVPYYNGSNSGVEERKS